MNTTRGTTLPEPLSGSGSTATKLRDSSTGSQTMSHGTLRQLCMLTLGGGLAFWAATIASSLLPIAAEFRSSFSISYGEGVLVGPPLGGMAIAAVLSWFLLRFFDKVPARDPLLMSVMLSCVALGAAIVMLWVAAIGIDGDSTRAFFIGATLNVPRFLALGLAIGYLRKRLRGPGVVQRRSGSGS
jgi:hypothetical protein